MKRTNKMYPIDNPPLPRYWYVWIDEVKGWNVKLGIPPKNPSFVWPAEAKVVE